MEFQNEILKDTGHLIINLDILNIDHWDLNQIENRTEILIDTICNIYKYPEVSATKENAVNVVDEASARNAAVVILSKTESLKEIKKNRFYKSANNSFGYAIMVSKMYPQGDRGKFWFALRTGVFEEFDDCKKVSCILVCRDKEVSVLNIPLDFLLEKKDLFNRSVDDEGNVKHYHIVLLKTAAGEFTMLLSNQDTKADTMEINITDYLISNS